MSPSTNPEAEPRTEIKKPTRRKIAPTIEGFAPSEVSIRVSSCFSSRSIVRELATLKAASRRMKSKIK